MMIAKVEISTVYAQTIYRQEIPRGIAGAQVEFSITDPMWDGLEKVVVFQGSCVRNAALQDNIAVMPQEVTADVGVPVRVGLYGCDAQKEIVIPTLWADLGTVKSAANPSGDPAGDPEFVPWVELREDMGDPEELQTQAKDSLVAAINELAKLGVSEAVIRETVEAFLKENDMTAGQDGATFIPAVSTSGILSWSNDKGLENPASVNIKGPKGEKGDTGAAGPQGEKGDTGATGPQGIRGATGATGPQGAAGADGVTPELTIGEVTTLSAGSYATASITGTKENPVLNLGIPKGADGSGSGTGGTGADGEDGGYYTPAIVQTNENTMTVSFSASKTGMAVVAEKTVTLPAGPQGQKGDTGAQGPQGQKGDTGADGYTPVKGVDYYTDADQAEMVELVLAALPTWEGGSY